MLLKAVGIAEAGWWNEKAGFHVVVELKNGLWDLIRRGVEQDPIDLAVQAYVQLDPHDLCQRVLKTQSLQPWVYSILMKSLPSSFVKAYGLESTSKGVWQDWAATNTVPLASTKEVAEMRRRLISDQIDDEARFSAIAFVGAIRDEGSLPALMSLLSRCPDQSSLVDCAVEAIANINTAESITLLISLVVSPETGEQVRKTAGYCLHRSSGTNATLDLQSQRLLLKHLAVNQSNQPVVASILQALEGHPIREGGEFIAELAVHDQLSAETRAQAVAVLKTVAMRELLDAVIPILLRDPTSIIAERTAEVAVSRRVPIFADFFKQRLGKNLSRLPIIA